MEGDLPPLKRPAFLPIIASHVLAATLAKKANGSVDGFIVEGPTAGGHNAPPRGKLQLNPAGEPVYGERDLVDLEKMRRSVCRSGWPAATAFRAGWTRRGGSVRTASRWAPRSPSATSPACGPTTKRPCCATAAAGTARVFTDPLASPTVSP